LSPARVIPLDESYTHQLVAPRLITTHPIATWAERCYHTVFDPKLMFHAGRAVYRYRGERTAFGGVARGNSLDVVRTTAAFRAGDDPDNGRDGPLHIETVKPLREIRLVLDDPGCPLAYDLTFRARFAPIATDRNVIEANGEVVTDYINFYQSGRYDGVVVLHGEEYRLVQRLGFRDRGWGIRKHEGAPRRGFVMFAALEMPTEVVYVLLYETASGQRVFTNGWLLGEDGAINTVAGVEHDLAQDDLGLVTGGRLTLRLAGGRPRVLLFTVHNRLFLRAAGYTAESTPTGYTHYDLGAPGTVGALDGQNDNGCTCELDGVSGHGVVETGIGAHPRYGHRPT
jgi:hypothetical protein